MPRITIKTEALTVNEIEHFLRTFCDRVVAGEQELSDLDSATGDADHGANLSRGMRAVTAMLDEGSKYRTPGTLLKEVGMKIVGTVGGSSGALYGTVFLRLAAVAGEAEAEVQAQTLAKGLTAAAQGIVDRGRARLGDKTMYDAIKPASDAFAEQCQAGGGLSQALQAAALAAEAGARATRNMRARRGKSSYVGDNSIGTVDPGAESMAWLIRCLADATKLAKS
jgi:dihydroxyacetone kinase-like protein